jgi:Secretion system C-terminal sorting domain/Dockerin type I domain
MKKNVNLNQVFLHLTLFSICLLQNASSLSSQNFKCATIPTSSQISDYNNRLARLGSYQQPQSAPNNNATIRIHVWVNKTEVDVDKIYDAINQVNPKFNFYNNAKFEVCKISRMSGYSDINYNDDAQWIGMNNTYHSDYMLNIYWVNKVYIPVPGGIEEFAGFASSIGVVVSAYNTNNIGHEVGHFFGLSHTFGGAKEYVTRLLSEGANCSILGRGDGLCGTDADPYRKPDLPLNTCNAPGSPCTFTDGNNRPNYPNGDVYTPPYYNFMSYYGSGNSFSSDQQAMMDMKLQEFELSTTKKLLFICTNKTMVSQGKISGVCEYDNPITEVTQKIKNYTISIDNLSTNTPTGSTTYTNSNGLGDNYFSEDIAVGNVAIKPSKYNDWLNGVTTFDISIINRHFLGIAPITNPFNKLAADVNNDGEIEGADMLHIRNLILRRVLTFPNNVGSYRFIPTYYLNSFAFQSQLYSNPFTAVYSNGSISKSYSPTNPTGSFMDRVELDLLTSDGRSKSSWEFRSIKMGDINCSMSGGSGQIGGTVESGLKSSNLSRYPMTSKVQANQLKSQKNVTLALKAKYEGDISSFQVGLKLSPTKMQLKKVVTGDFKSKTDEFEATKTDNGEVRALWYDNKAKNKDFTEGVTLMKFKVKTLDNIQEILNELKLDDIVLHNAFYGVDDNKVSVDLSLELDESEEVEENPYSVRSYPNPFNNELNFEIKTSKNEEATITIYNAFGSVLSTTNKNLNEGINVINISNTNRFPIGSLSYTVKTQTQLLNGYLTKVR